jgi:TonB family protein
MLPNSPSTSGPRTFRGSVEATMTEHPFVGLLVAGAASLVAHGFAYASLGLAPRPAHEAPPSHVSFRVQEAAPAPPPPPPPPVVEPPPPPRVERAKPKAAPSVNPEPPPAAAPPPAPVDLTGVTLTNDSGGSAWSSAVGNGSALNGPVGPIGPVTSVKPAASASAHPVAVRAAEIPVVAVSDLSARPVPPELAGSLRDHYPALAKQRGIGGSASVRARIEPDGRVRRVDLESETFAGFGDACKQTLAGSRWTAPRDRDGRAVATLIRYTCRFVVGP